MKIAVASTNGKIIDLHFGDADQFLIYKINNGNYEFDEIREKTPIPLNNHQERWVASIDLINDCKAVICSKIGKEPTIELRKMGIKPVQLDCNVKEAVKECSKHLLS
ncbi:NifB/NifX family molybdenum-iron cluster-binding protein [Methanobacterium alcaliphilum]|uniref:NifB/NifX family molybdenum-iron cluster-binding protein n=1 Tax=Methanobacterium alcaliphilum TaxID=392018 RepID=UPI00200A52EF|nr:NifB/NifX family molybdenum-iron cluster-binding protein [Methanobacterium alcaliphilum]MCK9151954.1 nitrogen fixation protein [Methanobacterium alcaliphilum]